MSVPERARPDPKSVETVDVLIITAADAEDEAVRLVEDGALGKWEETPGPSNYGFAVWRNRFQCPNGGQLTVEDGLTPHGRIFLR